MPPHPLISHWLAVMRNATTPSPMFRNACSELGRLLIYEAVRDFLPTVEGVVDTPLGPADVKCVDPTKPIKVGLVRACVLILTCVLINIIWLLLLVQMCFSIPMADNKTQGIYGRNFQC